VVTQAPVERRKTVVTQAPVVVQAADTTQTLPPLVSLGLNLGGIVAFSLIVHYVIAPGKSPNG